MGIHYSVYSTKSKVFRDYKTNSGLKTALNLVLSSQCINNRYFSICVSENTKMKSKVYIAVLSLREEVILGFPGSASRQLSH